MHHKTVFPQWLQQFVIVLQDDGNLIKNVTSVVALTTLMYYFIYTYTQWFRSVVHKDIFNLIESKHTNV